MIVVSGQGENLYMKVNLLGIDIDAITLDETVKRVEGFIRSGRPHRIVTINPEFLCRAQTEGELLELVKRADLVTADGEGVVWACRVKGTPVPERVTGIDLMARLLERGSARKWRVYLLGAAPGVAEKAAEKISQSFPGLQIAGTQHGYFGDGEVKTVVNKIKESSPDLIFVALGAPKQERWIDRHLEDTGVPAALGVGGSFDVFAGKARRAPAWIRRSRLEWLYRLAKEPSRWRRQLVLPLFAWTVIKKYKLKIN